MFGRLTLALIAAAALGTIAIASPSAFAASLQGSHSASARTFGWGYGRGWCYWHPYACYRN